MDLLGCLAAYFQNSDTDLERREGREGVEKGGREGGGGVRGIRVYNQTPT